MAIFKKEKKENKPVDKEELRLRIWDGVLTFATAIVGGGLVYMGWKAGCKDTEKAIALGLNDIQNKGLIKFFDFNGVEVSPDAFEVVFDEYVKMNK